VSVCYGLLIAAELSSLSVGFLQYRPSIGRARRRSSTEANGMDVQQITQLKRNDYSAECLLLAATS